MLSTWGIYQIVDSLHHFSDDIGRSIPPLGIVATKVQSNNLHRRVIDDLRARRLGRFGQAGNLAQTPLLIQTIRQAVGVARGADIDANIRTIGDKYGPAYDDFRYLTQEIKKLCEAKKTC